MSLPRGFALLVCATLAFAQLPRPVDRATFDRWMRELSNWGRWGPKDQLGTANLITPEHRRRAATLVKEGFSISLSRDADKVRSVDNGNPVVHQMHAHGADPQAMFGQDSYTFRFHGPALTHLDAMSHMLHGKQLYNGYPRESVNASGAHQLDVTAYKHGFFGRGILMDMPRLKGVKYLDLSVPIYPEDLDAWERLAGLRVGAGDIVFVRTGRWSRRAEKGAWDTDRASAGLHVSTARWFKQRDVAVIGSDVHAELMPSPVPGVAYPMHALFLTAMGMPMLDNCDLEPLSEAAAARRRWEFLLTAAAIPVPKGTGSPINPIATF